MDATQRLLILIDQAELGLEAEGDRDQRLRDRLEGEIQGYKMALAVLVGEREAAHMLRHRGGLAAKT